MKNTPNTDVSSDIANDLTDIISLLSDTTSSNDSTETNLLTSLKPYLNPKRQKKLEQCEKIITLTGTLKLLNELHFFDSLTEEEKT